MREYTRVPATLGMKVREYKSRTSSEPDRINKTRFENQLFISINGSENIKKQFIAHVQSDTENKF